MFLVTAIIKPHRLEDVTTALKGIDVNGITVSEVQGFGRQRGHSEVYRGSEYNVDYLPKTMIQIVCDASDADKIADVVADSARTGKIGDGKIWITELSRVVRIRTGETGNDAL
jgi:nitrogen regulatory protein P-II 1